MRLKPFMVFPFALFGLMTLSFARASAEEKSPCEVAKEFVGQLGFASNISGAAEALQEMLVVCKDKDVCPACCAPAPTAAHPPELMVSGMFVFLIAAALFVAHYISRDGKNNSEGDNTNPGPKPPPDRASESRRFVGYSGLFLLAVIVISTIVTKMMGKAGDHVELVAYLSTFGGLTATAFGLDTFAKKT